MPELARMAAVAGALLALAGCAAAPAGVGTAPLEGTAWVVTTLPGRDLVPGSTVTLRLGAGEAAGTDGCNRYAAPYTLGGDRLEIDGARAVSTMMACPAPVMEQASAYLAALARTHGFRITGDRLALVTNAGELLATFRAGSGALDGTAWRVTGYNNGRQAVVSVLAGTTLTLAFAGDGQAAGSAGCNRYTAGWSGSGEKLGIGPPAATRRFCAAPPGVMEQEAAFLAALATVASARVEGGRLELRTASGALAVSLVADPGPG